jgi:hypothetical protein
MSQEKVPLPEPCVSKKSITSDQFGVLYASPNGLVSIAPGTQDVISRALFTRDEWQTYLPSSIVGAIYQNMYIAFYQVGSTKAALVLLRGDSPPLITFETAAQAVFVEKATANIYIVSSTDNLVYQLDADPVNMLFYEWMSKKFILNEPTNYAVSKSQADWESLDDSVAYNAIVAEITASNQAIWVAGTPLQSTLNSTTLGSIVLGGSILANIPSLAETQNIQAMIYANGVLIANIAITGQEPVRLPAAQKDYVYEVRLTGNAALRKFAMATSVAELRQL